MNFIADAGEVRRALARHAPTLPPAAHDRLVALYSEARLPATTSHEPVAVDPKVRISIEEGAGLYDLVRQHSISSAIEIGFAYGFSTVWLLAALMQREGARHVAIDPFELNAWHGIGLRQVELLDSGVEFEWIGESSVLAMPDLIRRETKVDFVFIDSRHIFDETLVEFYLADRLLPPGGLVAFDDLWMPSIRAVLNFVLRNRNYERIRQPVKNLCVLRKVGEDERAWNHFRPFRTGGFPPLEMARKWKQRLVDWR